MAGPSLQSVGVSLITGVSLTPTTNQMPCKAEALTGGGVSIVDNNPPSGALGTPQLDFSKVANSGYFMVVAGGFGG